MADKESRMLPVAFEKNWAGKPCRFCGEPASAHAYLYDKAQDDPIDQTKDKPIGEVFQHDDKDDCQRVTEAYIAKVKG
jgi:hypothetical protein